VNAEIINSFLSIPQHLVLDIGINLTQFSNSECNLPEIDFSPLAVLGAASLSIPRIDIYVHSGCMLSTVRFAQLISSLEKCEGIMKLVEEGVVVIHSQMRAPVCK